MRPTWNFDEGVWSTEFNGCEAEIVYVQIDEDGTTVWLATVTDPRTNTEDTETRDPTGEGLAYLMGWCDATMNWMGA